MTQKENYQMYLQEIRLGDKLECLFKWTGIKFLVHKIYPNCGCEFRKDWLNGEANEIKVKRK